MREERKKWREKKPIKACVFKVVVVGNEFSFPRTTIPKDTRCLPHLKDEWPGYFVLSIAARGCYLLSTGLVLCKCCMAAGTGAENMKCLLRVKHG